MARLSSDSSYEVRSSAACALIEMGVTEALFTALKDGNVHVRLDASAAAARTADEALTSRLLTEAHSPLIHIGYFEGIMDCLARIKRPEVVDSLISLLKDRSALVRQNAARALGTQGDTRAIEPLAEAIGDPEYKVRSKAVCALGLVKNPAVLAPLDRALRDSVYDVRRQAVIALCDLGDPRAIPLLQRQIRRESEPNVKEWMSERLRDFRARPMGSKSKAQARKSQSAWRNIARWLRKWQIDRTHPA